MDPVNRYFTQSVVGTPKRMSLGVATRAPNGLRWGPVENIQQGRAAIWTKKLMDISQAGRKLAVEMLKKPLLWASMGVLVVSTSIGFAYKNGYLGGGTGSAKEVTNVEPKVAAETPSLSSIRIEKTEYESNRTESAPNQEVQGIVPGGPLPIFSPPVASIKLAPTEPPKATPQPTAQPTKTKEPEKQVSAIVLDKAEEKRKPTVTPPTVQKTAPVEPPHKIDPRAQDKEAQAPKSEKATDTASAGQFVTVVDIDKKGAYVLITNPATRLPEKFTVGQKIFTGETITKIDPASGVIKLGNRSVSMY